MERRQESRRAPVIGGVIAALVLSLALPAPATAADDDAPFTLVVLPDTQNYSYANQAVLDAQLTWVRDSMADLDAAFVMQVGDLVSDWDNPRHWENVSGAFEILDDADVPYTVLPGNHDFDEATGDVSVFNSHFPPSRHADAAWNTAERRYGGYLGQSQFGPDPIDRGNADNYALFTAGGTDFLVLNLEWEAPGYALDWADRVLDAHPNRTVIMATHSFLTVNGLRMTTPQRPGGTSTAALWEQFVSTHCQIRLVVAGHSNVGDLGEANRTDLNSCGQPVQQILTDYQSRANGGNGWLRYYTFDPAANTMRATTYSPTLDQFETDANSAFTVPFELSETPPTPQTAIAADAFGRSTASGWGTADVGGPWTVSLGSTGPLSVSGGVGRMSLIPGQTRMAGLDSIATTDAVVDLKVASGSASSGGAAHTTIIGRQVGSSTYGLNVRFEPGGRLRLYLLRGNTALDVADQSWTAGVPLSIRLSVSGTSPTQLAAKVWPAGGSEPTGWQLQATDAAAALQSPGSVAIRSSVSSSSSVPSTVLSFDDLQVVSATAPPPPPPPPANEPPAAVIGTPTIDDLTVSLTGAASSDPDGTVVSHAWLFGDGTGAAGPTTTHTYGAAGSYTITLTVTDDAGATASATRAVTVSSAPPPPPPPPPPPGDDVLAADGFARTVGSGWGTADVGGAWTVSAGTSSPLSVADGAGRMTLIPSQTRFASLASVSTTEAVVEVRLRSEVASSGGAAHTTLIGRQVGGSSYGLNVRFEPGGQLRVYLLRDNTALGAYTGTWTPGEDLTARLSVTGTSPTQLAAKIWPTGGTEPADWQLVATDSAGALQSAGSVTIKGSVSSSSSVASTRLVFDDLRITAPAAP
ncbi:PKD domain-containing protein [Agrococcus sp. ProA11]|uniref:PKD domain-containing protein n=1 Tax=Agrococcus chionoecetis TaxID=3153752 RepID=UPI0032606DF7